VYGNYLLNDAFKDNQFTKEASQQSRISYHLHLSFLMMKNNAAQPAS
jgi:hypothetical protein